MNKNLETKMNELSLDYMSANTFGHELGHHAFKAGGQAMHDLMIEDMKKYIQVLKIILNRGKEFGFYSEEAENVFKQFKEKYGDI